MSAKRLDLCYSVLQSIIHRTPDPKEANTFDVSDGSNRSILTRKDLSRRGRGRHGQHERGQGFVLERPLRVAVQSNADGGPVAVPVPCWVAQNARVCVVNKIRKSK